MKKILIGFFGFFLLYLLILAGAYFYISSKIGNPEWTQSALKTISISFFEKMCREEIKKHYARNNEALNLENIEKDLNECGCFSERSAQNFSKVLSEKKMSIIELIESLPDEDTRTVLQTAVGEAKAFCKK